MLCRSIDFGDSRIQPVTTSEAIQIHLAQPAPHSFSSSPSQPNYPGLGADHLLLKMTEPTIPVLPANAELTYLDEGAANIVYRISISQPQPGTPRPTELDEYGEGTPPPSEIEFDDEGGDFGVFESMYLFAWSSTSIYF